MRILVNLEMKPLGICPFSAEKLLLHCFEEANQMGVEEIPHPQNNQQDFNSLIAKFTNVRAETRCFKIVCTGKNFFQVPPTIGC
jgi:hypothetical protein